MFVKKRKLKKLLAKTSPSRKTKNLDQTLQLTESEEESKESAFKYFKKKWNDKKEAKFFNKFCSN